MALRERALAAAAPSALPALSAPSALPAPSATSRAQALVRRTEKRQTRATAGALAVVVVVVLAVCTLLVIHVGRPATTASRASTTGTVEVGSVSSSSTDSPSAALEARRRTDRAALADAVDRWVPQVGSKKVGLVADGVTYDESAIWEQFQSTLASHPEARLANSSDWSSFRQGSYWVTVIDQPFSTPAQANAWCDSAGYPTDQCYAKRLTTSGGYAGNTVMRH